MVLKSECCSSTGEYTFFFRGVRQGNMHCLPFQGNRAWLEFLFLNRLFSVQSFIFVALFPVIFLFGHGFCLFLMNMIFIVYSPIIIYQRICQLIRLSPVDQSPVPNIDEKLFWHNQNRQHFMDQLSLVTLFSHVGCTTIVLKSRIHSCQLVGFFFNFQTIQLCHKKETYNTQETFKIHVEQKLTMSLK